MAYSINLNNILLGVLNQMEPRNHYRFSNK